LPSQYEVVENTHAFPNHTSPPAKERFSSCP
jgi:hypothetical protein